MDDRFFKPKPQIVILPSGKVGIPSGGTAGEVLVKSADTDYAASFQTFEAFAVGDYHFNSTGINPGSYLGYGTWVKVAQGQFLVGEA